MGSTVHTRCCAKCASASQLAELQTSFGATLHKATASRIPFPAYVPSPTRRVEESEGPLGAKRVCGTECRFVVTATKVMVQA